jgi:Hint module
MVHKHSVVDDISLSLSHTFAAPTITVSLHNANALNCKGEVSSSTTHTSGTCEGGAKYTYITGVASVPSTSSVPIPSASPNAAPSVPSPNAAPTVFAAPTVLSPNAAPTVLSPNAAPAGATASVSGSSTSSKDCFAGSETLIMESGELKAMSSIRVGDRVLAANVEGQTLFSEVVFIPHGANKDEATFIYATTETGRDLKLTMNHVLPAGVCGTTLSLKYASKVVVGDCINTLSGQEKVSMVQSVRGKGLYTIVTNDEYLVVNGIIVSPFSANHLMANLYYNIHRFVYMTSPFLLTWPNLHATNEVSKCSECSKSFL